MKITTISAGNLKGDLPGGAKQITPVSFIISDVYPKRLTYNLSVNHENSDMLINCMMVDKTREELIKAITSEVCVLKILSELIPTRSGIFKKDVKVSSLAGVIDAVKAGLIDHGFKRPSWGLIHGITALLLPFLNRLDILLTDEEYKTVITHDSPFLSKDEYIKEMIRLRLSGLVSQINFDVLKEITSSRDVTLAVVANRISREFVTFTRQIMDLTDVEIKLNTLLTLIGSYLLDDRSGYGSEEAEIFSNSRLIEAANNYSLMEMALSQYSEGQKPSSAHYFWQGQIEATLETLSTSNRYGIKDFNAIKTMFDIDVLFDGKGIRKGIVVSEAVKDSTPFEMIHEIKISDALMRFLPFKQGADFISGTYSALQKFDSKLAHRLYVDNLTQLIDSDTELLFASDVEESSTIKMLAAAHADSISVYRDADNEISYIYNNDITESRIVDEYPYAFGMSKTNDHWVSLLSVKANSEATTYRTMDAQSFTDENALYSYHAIKKLLTAELDKSQSVTFEYNEGKKTKHKIVLKELTIPGLIGNRSLKNAKIVTPYYLKDIMSNFITAVNNLDKFIAETLDDKKKISYDHALNIQILNIIKPLLSEDLVVAVASGLTNKIWLNLPESVQKKGFVAAKLQDKYMQVIIQLTALDVVCKSLGIIDGDQFNELITRIKDSGFMYQLAN